MQKARASVRLSAKLSRWLGTAQFNQRGLLARALRLARETRRRSGRSQDKLCSVPAAGRKGEYLYLFTRQRVRYVVLYASEYRFGL